MRTLLGLLSCLIAVTFVSTAESHTIRPAVATVVISPEGQLDVQIRLNMEAIVAGIDGRLGDTSESPNAAQYDSLRLKSPAELAQEFAGIAPQFLQRPLLQVDGKILPLSYLSADIPEVGDVELSRDSMLHLEASLPANSKALVWQWPPDLGSSVIRVQHSDGETVLSTWLQTGEISEPYPVDSFAPPASRWDVISNYIEIGFEHILPKGLDHTLFVVGIFLLSVQLKPLLLQVSAFTIAHTITLGLSIYGVIALPASVVEPLIALSIAYVGVENCLSSKLQPWRLGLVFCFGLLHGMGFAGVLSEIGLPRSDYLTALISFNIGVEFGQLAVIAACLVLVGWCRNRSWYRSAVVIPGSLAIAVTGLYWTWERIFA